MTQLKHALFILKFEFKHSARYFLLQILLIVVLLYLFISSLPHMATTHMGLDIFFLAILMSFSQLFIPKPFKAQSLQDGMWASHFLIMLNQLAIPKKTIAIYRLISYYLLTLMFSGVFLIGLYLSSSYVRENVPISTYSVFIILSLSISLTIGGAQLVMETGYNLILSLFIVFLVIGPIFFIIIFFLFYILYPNGLILWLLMISTKWPIITSLFSMTMAVTSHFLWVKLMKKRMAKMDYYS